MHIDDVSLPVSTDLTLIPTGIEIFGLEAVLSEEGTEVFDCCIDRDSVFCIEQDPIEDMEDTAEEDANFAGSITRSNTRTTGPPLDPTATSLPLSDIAGTIRLRRVTVPDFWPNALALLVR